jgi:hypothetical protein
MFNALIRTHHITSRKKVTKLKQAADATQVFALLRSGSSPGIMYVEGAENSVRQWVDSVHVSIKSFLDNWTWQLTQPNRTFATRTIS